MILLKFKSESCSFAMKKKNPIIIGSFEEVILPCGKRNITSSANLCQGVALHVR
jgi:hypothetical protein